MPAVPRPGGGLSPTDQQSLQQQLTQAYLRTGQVPKGYKVIQSAPTGRTRNGPMQLGPQQPQIVRDPSWWDEWREPLMVTGGILGGAYLGPALLGGGSNSLASAGINAGINAGTTAATGGSFKDIALSGLGGAASGGNMASWTDILKDPNTWASVATIAGNAAGGRQDDRLLTGQQTNQSNLADLALFTASQNAQNQAGQLDINRKQFSEDARGGRARQALIGDLLGNLQDININVPGVQTASVTGGLRPSALGAGGKQAAGELHKQALMAMLNGDQFQGGQVLTPPTFAPMPQKGGVESALDWIGLLGGLAGGIGRSQEPTTHSQLPSTQQPDPVLRNQRNVRF